MNALDRKLFRDLWQMKGQVTAISLVLCCGVAMFIMSLSTRDSLQTTQLTYYERYHFADVFGHLKRAPLSLAQRIAAIPGIARVEPRIVVGVTLDVKDLPEPAVGRILSIPDRPTATLNGVCLRRGRYIEPGRNEILASENFAEAHKLNPGDSITAVINGKKQRLTIAGLALSPEFVYQIPPGELFPNDRHYGVLWMSYKELATAFDMDGAFNDLAATLLPGASEPAVLERIDRITEPYGGLGAYGRHDQMSNRFLSDEIKQLSTMGLIMPSIFLGVAAFLLNVVLTRLVSTQREQIAALKAFGYTRLEVGFHYLKMVLVMVAIGSALGIVLGTWFGRVLTELYTLFYRFPVFYFKLNGAVVALAMGIGAAAAILGTLGAVWRAIHLPPAEALRPEPPATYRLTILERLGMQRLLAQTARMVLRQLERRPLKAIFSCVAIALGVAVLILGSFGEDAIGYMMEFQFDISQRQELTVSFVEPTAGRALHELEHLPGVLFGEPFRSVPVRLRAGHRTRRVAIQGMEPEGTLSRVVDESLRVVPLPAEGMVVSAKLAELLGVDVGDAVRVEVLEGARPIRSIAISGLVHDYTGTAAYMDRRALNRFMREENSISGAYLMVDAAEVSNLYQRLKNTPRVAGVTIRASAKQSFEKTVGENMMLMRVFNIIFASVIAFGVVYNNARISLAERSRELATLRVIGFTRGEISAILLGELGVLTLIAIPFGLLVGYSLVAAIALALDTEMYRIPVVVNPQTYGFAATVVLIATVLSALSVRRKLDHLDLVEVLKSKE